MEILIWSDVRCPFCYIGKKKFEAALDQFPQKDEVKVIWKSFELDPSLKTRSDRNTVAYFVEAKGVSVQQAEKMMEGAQEMGKSVGLELHLKESIPANSFKAHRLIQMAKQHSLADEIEEALFKAHFVDVRNIDDDEVLIDVASSVGLQTEEVREVLKSNDYAEQVRQDQMEASRIGVRGVPFFVFDNRYAISGAQSTEAFLETIEKAYEEFKKVRHELHVVEGKSCDTGGNC